MLLFKRPPRSLCIFRLSAIGDVCHTLPILRTLQATWPDTKITWIIGKLDDKKRAKDFQWLFSKQRIAPEDNRHVMDGLFGFTKALGIQHEIHAWNVPISQTDTAFALNTLNGKKTVLISPCSSERKNNFRNWSAQNFANLCTELLKRDYQILLTGGPSSKEKYYGEEITQLTNNSNVINLIGKTSLKQLYALISAVDLVIAPDSGPIHMANSTSTACIGLYASSNPLRTGPYHQQNRVVNKYPEALKIFLNKDITAVKWGQRVRNSEVMSLIRIDDVLEKIELIQTKT